MAEQNDSGVNYSIDCGWGRLIFAQTFESNEKLVEDLRAERADQRDIALYANDPHVLLALAPHELFLDPSHTFRIDLSSYEKSDRPTVNYSIRHLSSRNDAEQVNRIYHMRGMVPVDPEFFWDNREASSITYLVAEEDETGAVIGTVMGVDHVRAFGDPEGGSSLWCLAVDSQAKHGGIGEMLVRRLCEHFAERGNRWMDLSVLHDNRGAISLYEKIGFQRVPYFCVKRKNAINENLFVGPEPDLGLNPYAKIIIDEARRRGIHVDVIDVAGGFFALSYGGRTIKCRESLSEFTTAVAMSICDDKTVTRRIVSAAGVTVPQQVDANADQAVLNEFLAQHGKLVVKPARGEQGAGITVGVETEDELIEAITAARTVDPQVLVEELVEGDDLRLIVINYRVVAAAMRRPAQVVGDGRSSVRELIERQSRRRSAATEGESRIPIDGDTKAAVAAAGLSLDDVPEEGRVVQVRRTANLHTGGTIHDVTNSLHPELRRAAVLAARAVDIPCTGIDLIIKSPKEPDYAFIEANERPGLANHEPQPTAERFIDLLFPLSIPSAQRSDKVADGELNVETN